MKKQEEINYLNNIIMPYTALGRISIKNALIHEIKYVIPTPK